MLACRFSHFFSLPCHHSLSLAVKSWQSRYESSPLKKRFWKVREVQESQERYTDNLRKIYQVEPFALITHSPNISFTSQLYWAPLKEESSKVEGCISSEQVQSLFSNLDKILSLAETMSEALGERINNRPDHHDLPVGECLMHHVRNAIAEGTPCMLTFGHMLRFRH